MVNDERLNREPVPDRFLGACLISRWAFLAESLVWRTWRAGALLVTVISLGLFLYYRSSWGSSFGRSSSDGVLAVDAAAMAKMVPARVRPMVRPFLAKDSPEAVCISRVLQQSWTESLTVPHCCHFLRLNGLDVCRHPRFSSGREIVNALTNQKSSETYFGEPIFFQTRSGIRYRDATNQKSFKGENHRDICLATFAELGLPLSTPIKTVDATFNLRDLLRDSVENFDLKQRELTWTAVGFAIYLSPQRAWTNRYGESFTFDDLAKVLIQANLEEASCGGAHLVYAMTILWRVDASDACLSEPVRDALTRCLRERITAIVESQSKAGYWTLAWHTPGMEKSDAQRSSPHAPDSRLLATGHLLEWLELLPAELQPPQDVYRRAARWLCGALQERLLVVSAVDFCPWIHAVCAVRTLVAE